MHYPIIEADCNWMSKLHINKKLIPSSEELGLIPDEESCSRKDLQVINVTF